MKMLKRHQREWIIRALDTFPLVALTGARQVGKSTLAQQIIDETGGDYVTLDAPAILSGATADPSGVVRRWSALVVIDEVQLAPDLLPAIKVEIDSDRRPGRFLLTGSANLLKMRDVTESLAGRSVWLELPPLTWAELLGAEMPTTFDAAFSVSDADTFLESLGAPRERHVDLARARAVIGGMPGLIGLDEAGRRLWYDAYRTTFLERDLRQLTRIENLPDFNRLTTLAFLRTGSLLNRADLARDASLDYNTAKRYLSVLEVAYQLLEVSPFLPNLGKRLVKSPKLYARDVGMAGHAANVGTWEDAVSVAKAGALLETWVVNEVIALDALSTSRSSIHFWRTGAGAEVDVVLERGAQVVAIEVKSSATVRHRDTRGIRTLRDDLGERFKLGVVAYMGDEARVLDDRLVLVPIASMLGATR
jgi:predicted AAA+ superfamily ATPase